MHGILIAAAMFSHTWWWMRRETISHCRGDMGSRCRGGMSSRYHGGMGSPFCGHSRQSKSLCIV